MVAVEKTRGIDTSKKCVENYKNRRAGKSYSFLYLLPTIYNLLQCDLLRPKNLNLNGFEVNLKQKEAETCAFLYDSLALQSAFQRSACLLLEMLLSKIDQLFHSWIERE